MSSTPSQSLADNYQFGPWQLSTKQQLLTRTDTSEQHTLEPLIFELLIYFIQHSGEIVSRQSLVDNVWKMSYVDDNAINRAMSELRKVLKLPDVNETYIKTHYKKGYSFIPEVTPVQTEKSVNFEDVTLSEPDARHSTTALPTETAKSVKNKRPIVLGFVLIFVGALVWLAFSANLIGQTSADSKPKSNKFERNNGNKQGVLEQEKVVSSRIEVSWQEGLFFLPKFSPSQQFLAYSFRPPGERFMQLKVKNMESQVEWLLAQEAGDVYPVSWYSDSIMVYRVLNTDPGHERCDYLAIDINQPDSTPRYLWHCNHSYTANAALIDDQQTLLVKEYNYRNKSYASAIYSVDLASRTKFQVTSPSITGTGDFYFSVSNQHRQFAFLRNTDTKIELFVSDVEGSNQTKLIDLDFKPGSITWSENDDALLWLDHRTWQLVKYDLASGQMSAKAFASQGRINPSYAVSVADFNRLVIANDYIDNDVYALSLGSSSDSTLSLAPLANSKVKEGHGQMLTSSREHLYVTFDGVSRVWRGSGANRTSIYELESNKLRNTDLSNDDSFLLFNYGDYVIRLDLKTQELETQELPFSAIKVKQLSDSKWVVTYEEQNKIRLGLYDQRTKELTSLTDKSITAFSIINDNQVIFSDSEEVINRVDTSTKTIEPLFKISNLIPQRWAADDKYIYYSETNNRIAKRALTKTSQRELLYEVSGMTVVGMKLDKQLGESYLVLSIAKLRSNFLYDIRLSSQN